MATAGINRPSIGFVATALVLLACAAVTYGRVRSLQTNERLVSHTFEVLQTLARTLADSRAAESALRGFLLTHDDLFLENYQPVVDDARRLGNKVIELTLDDSAQNERARKLTEILGARFAVLDDALRHDQTHQPGAASSGVANRDGVNLMRAAESLATDMRTVEGDLLKRRSLDSERSSEIVLAAIAATVVVTLTFLWLVARLVARASHRERGVQREIRQVNAKLAALNETLERRVDDRTRLPVEANEELNAFAYTIAHDLRAPLRNMYGFAKALSEDYAPSLGEQGRDYADRIMRAAKRLDELIQDLLAYSRLTRTEVVLEPVNLTKLVSSVIAEFEPQLQERGATIEPAGDLPQVCAQTTMLTQMLSNLISNALKFVPPERKPMIRIAAQRLNGIVRLSVGDNGIGIANQYHERIFKVFERLHGQSTYPGTGIGLAIVRKGAERMNGKVGVESVLGSGSEFWIELAEA